VTHVVVVGGGITGLAAAHRLRALLGSRVRITVVEQAGAVGGKLRTIELAGTGYDVGAETFLVRRPEAVTLVRELGLGGRLVHPTPARAGLRAGGRTAPLPGRTMLGVPADPDGLAGVLTPGGLARARAERDRPLRWSGADAAVGPLVTERFGAEVTQRLVEPLLGGVYAGRAQTLGLRATMPALAAELDRAASAGRSTSLTESAAAVLRDDSGAPVFGALVGGMRVLVDALRAASGAQVRTGLPVRALHRTADGWRVEIGAAPRPEFVEADAVVLAVPPPALRKLLAPLCPAASAAAGGIDVASMAIVALALPGDVVLPESSGVLVAEAEPIHAKAFTYSGRKWAHLGGGPVLVRASIGRHGDAGVLPAGGVVGEAGGVVGQAGGGVVGGAGVPADGGGVGLLQADDDELVAAVRADLATLTGITAPPLDTLVVRWGGGLPQYAVGHLDRVAAIETAVAALPGLAVAGAALHGVGIAACIGTADTAAGHIAEQLATRDGSIGAWPG
jgi:protoporphyrinogen/coproporphyrinogen III oxidase